MGHLPETKGYVIYSRIGKITCLFFICDGIPNAKCYKK